MIMTDPFQPSHCCCCCHDPSVDIYCTSVIMGESGSRVLKPICLFELYSIVYVPRLWYRVVSDIFVSSSSYLSSSA